MIDKSFTPLGLNPVQYQAFLGLCAKIEDLENQLAAAVQTIEDVAIGVKLECPICQKYKPCCCDKGESHEPTTS